MCIRDRSSSTTTAWPSTTRRSARTSGSARTTPCLLYTSPSPRDRTRSRMPSSALTKQRPPRYKLVRSSAASDVYKRQIFVNYDGVAKHHTTVGSHVRIGSDNTLVAPVSIGDGAYTGAGSVIPVSYTHLT